jgi:hypothetical protein
VSDKDELLIRIYDEDYGIKGQLDQILSIEGDIYAILTPFIIILYKNRNYVFSPNDIMKAEN